MAAYAALVSLMNTIDNIKNHPRLSTSLENYQIQIQSLVEKLDFLLDFVESDNSHGGESENEVEDLEIRITSAAYWAEDVIESYIVDLIHAGSTEKGSISLEDLQKVMVDLDSIMEKASKVTEKRRSTIELPKYSLPTISSRSRFVAMQKSAMVGFDGYLLQLLDLLTREQPDWQMISIIGMGGIGKTTLARNAYQNSLVLQYFDVCAWVTVSQEYNLRQILLEILSCVAMFTPELDIMPENELGELLYKSLSHKRCLIVLDDVWDKEAWDKIKFFIPSNTNRSRIIVTTRISNLYDFAPRIVLNFLDEEDSWRLFCNNTFEPIKCPVQLYDIGKRIVRQCKGLPLAIVAIAGFLRKSPRVQEYWENFAQDIMTIPNSQEHNQCLDTLSLSYSRLPAHLKPCFLYMGILLEDNEIRVSRLIKLLVAEGFIKPNSNQGLEDIAEGYIKDLIERNLIYVGSLGSSGKVRTCKIHDLLRFLCIRIAQKEKFLGATMEFGTPHYNIERRIIIQGSTGDEYFDPPLSSYTLISRSTGDKYYDPQLSYTLKSGSTGDEYHNPMLSHTLRSAPVIRTVILERPSLLLFKSRLLRILIEVYDDSLDTTFQQVNLRFLACESIRAPIGWIRTYKLPSSISLLWNVQTLIIDKNIAKVVAPSEIWTMPQLRHLKFHRISLPDPPSDKQDSFVLQNLQTLGTVLDFKCSEEVCRRIPNIRKLHMFYDDFSGEDDKSSSFGLDNLGCFNKLRSLSCCFLTIPKRKDFLQYLNFPCFLEKLILQDCEIQWSDLTKIGALPLLKVLKLKHQSARGREWNPVEGEFLSLQHLEIDSCYLIHWNAESSHFPRLQNIVLCRLYRLIEIPLDISHIPTLQNISMVDCSVSAAISAMKVAEEQEFLGSEGIQVRVKFRGQAQLDEFMMKMGREGCSSKNFHIDGVGS